MSPSSRVYERFSDVSRDWRMSSVFVKLETITTFSLLCFDSVVRNCLSTISFPESWKRSEMVDVEGMASLIEL